MELIKVIKIIGAAVFVALMFATVICCPLSFALSWPPYIQFITTAGTIGIYICFTIILYFNADE